MGFIDSIKDAITSMRQTVSTDDARRREFLQREAQFGATLFGPIPDGIRRDFFCLDETTWVWHESWTDQNGDLQHVTTRYDIYPTTIVKSQNGRRMHMSVTELENFTRAVQAYYPLVAREVYGLQFQQA
jgi:hypothetical protein